VQSDNEAINEAIIAQTDRGKENSAAARYPP